MWHWKLKSRRRLLTKVIIVLFNQLMVMGIYGKLCETETGQNNIILDIEESRGDGKFKHCYFIQISHVINSRRRYCGVAGTWARERERAQTYATFGCFFTSANYKNLLFTFTFLPPLSSAACLCHHTRVPDPMQSEQAWKIWKISTTEREWDERRIFDIHDMSSSRNGQAKVRVQAAISNK